MAVLQKKYEIKPDWKTSLSNDNKEIRKEIKELSKKKIGGSGFINLQENLKLNEYRIQHNLKPSGSNFFIDTQSLIGLINVFTIIIASTIVASEFAWGTIKLLSIRPFRRSKILWAKYIAVFLFTIFLLSILLFCSSIISGSLFGFHDTLQNVVYIKDGTVIEQNVFGFVLQKYGVHLIETIMLGTMAFMIATIFRNQAMAVGIPLFLLYMGKIITDFLYMKYDWAKYILFANINLSQYIDEASPLIPGMTLTFSITVLCVYYFAFMLITWMAYLKRDIAT